MAIITIKDLSENAELDRKAMRDISGGARYRTGAGAPGARTSRSVGIVDFRTGIAPVTGAAAKPAAKQPR